MNKGVLFQVMNEGEVLDVYGIVSQDGETYFVVYNEGINCFDLTDITVYTRL